MVHDDDIYEVDPIEGYCMRCRDSVDMEEPKAVWTRKGQAATRGICSVCGGNVFRMGKTQLHDEKNRPDAIHIGSDDGKRHRPTLVRDTIYINYAQQDRDTAQAIATSLEKSGMAVWLHDTHDQTQWSSGVHPALKQCSRMVLILSSQTENDDTVIDAWRYFRQNRKSIVIAQIDTTAPPDEIRRSPRFDFRVEFKSSLRQMLGELSR